MAKKTSLNKGLEALLGDVAESKNSEKPQKNVKKETKEKSSEILLSQIKANQYQPRTSFDQNEGKRFLKGCYIDHDSTEGKLRHLERKFNLKWKK